MTAPKTPLLTPQTRHRRRVPTSLLVLLAAAGAGAGYVAIQARRPAGTPVEVTPARQGPLVVDWSATGYVEARAAQVSPPLSGRVVSVEVAEGAPVAAGQVLARLAADAEQAAAAGRSEATAAAAADAEAARASLRETEGVLQERVDRARADVAVARQRVRVAEAGRDRSRRGAAPALAGARARAEAARYQLADLEAGPRVEEITQAEASLADAQAAALRARTERDRQAALLREGAVARRALDDATEAQTRAEAQVRRLRAALDLVRRGARPDEVAAARARLRAAQEEIAAAEAQVAGVEVDERQVGEAAAAVRAAEAALSEARAGLGRRETLRQQARAAQSRVGEANAGRRQAAAVLAERVVTAPFAGRVGRRMADPGDLAVPGQPLFTIVEANRAWVEAEVDEQDLAPLRLGAPVTLSMAAHPGRRFAGRVERIGAEALPQMEQTRTSARIVRVRVSLAPTPPADRALFKPGMEVDVAGQDTVVASAVLVPNDSLLQDAAGSYLYVVEGGRARQRRVRPGYAAARETQVLEGVRPGESIVVGGKEALADGKIVLPRPAAP